MRRRSFLAAAPAPFAARLSAAPPEQKFRLGAVTYEVLKKADLATILRELETAGYAAVELRTGHGHGVEPTLGPAERQRVREQFSRSPVKLLSYGTTCRFQSPDPEERRRQIETAKSFIDLAHDTGAIGIKLQPQGFAPGVSPEAIIGYFGQAMRELGEYGLPRGVETWMEVHGRGTAEPPVAAAMLKAANHPQVGACWNSNPSDVVNGSIQTSFALLRPWLRNVHLHDLTDQSYPYRELFRLLQQSGYQRYTLCEAPESPEPARFLGYYRELWRELNRFC